MSHSVRFAKDPRAATVASLWSSQTARRKDVVLLDKGGYVTLDVAFGKVSRTTGTDTATFKQRYVSGRRRVKNSRYFSAKKRIADLQKRYASAQRSFSRIRCSGGGVRGRDCGRGEYQRLQSLRKDISRAQGDLRGGPTVVQAQYAEFSYPVKKPYVMYGYPVRVTVRWPSPPRRKPAVLNYKAGMKGSGLVLKAYRKVGVRASNKGVPANDRILQATHGEAAKLIGTTLAKVAADRAAQKMPKGLSAQGQADHWLTTYCVRDVPNSYEVRKRVLASLAPEAKAMISRTRHLCRYDDFGRALGVSKVNYRALAPLETGRGGARRRGGHARGALQG